MNSDFSVGNKLVFGKYKGVDITWRILAQKGNKLLIISEKGLDTIPYNEEIKDITWEKCTLRKWLNTEFIDSAFSQEQQKYIIQSEVENSGIITLDKVFLLSIDEVNKYFKDDIDRQCIPADNLTLAVKSLGYKSCWWWLRSPGGVGHHASEVKSEGSINHFGRNVCRVSTVRPALWIDF